METILNCNKTQSISQVNFKIIILQINFCRELGIPMQDDVTFEIQISKVCSKVRQQCGWIKIIFYDRTPKFMKHMYTTLVQPHKDHCSRLWAPPGGGKLERLEGCLRNFTSKIPSLKHLPSYIRHEDFLRPSFSVRQAQATPPDF